MPLRSATLTSPGNVYGRPFDGPTDNFAQGVIDITALTADEIDSFGYIKPGVPVRQVSAGVFGLVSGAGQSIFGIVPEYLKVAAGNDSTSIAAASAAFPIGIVTICSVRRGIIEENLGRVLSADELAAFAAAGRNPVLLG